MPLHIMVSRTDSIGDVVLTLPVARMLKEHFPGVRISFLGRAYTRAVAEACIHIDDFVDRDLFLEGGLPEGLSRPDAIIHVFPDPAIARKARDMRIPVRIGATGRWYHWSYCNRLVRMSRRRSALHEAQLNLKLLEPFGIRQHFSKEEIGRAYGLERLSPLLPEYRDLLEPGKFHLVLHPGSRGSAREWHPDQFIRLAGMLDPGRFRIFITGTSEERQVLQPLLNALGDRVVDIVGLMPLPQFISFLGRCQGIVAASTGPLHLAAAMGLHAVGIYPSERPVHPGRWAPLGSHAMVFTSKRHHDPGLQTVTPEEIANALDRLA